MSVDLEPQHLAEVRSILQRNVPELIVWAFGSRITGTAKKFSDLDLALVTYRPLPKEKIGELRESFSDSNLPIRVDVIDLASVSPDFKSIVEKNHIVLQNGKGNID